MKRPCVVFMMMSQAYIHSSISLTGNEGSQMDELLQILQVAVFLSHSHFSEVHSTFPFNTRLNSVTIAYSNDNI